MTKRGIAITKARIAGYENDTRTLTRLIVESRVAREHLYAAWAEGEKLRNVGTSQQAPTDCHSILGTIPAEESDEEFCRQIEEMS